MSIPDEIMREVHSLPDTKKQEVLNFARYLRIRDEIALDMAMDDIITNNLEAFKELAK